MQRMGADDLFYYWRVLVPCPARRCRYAFCLSAGPEQVWLTEDGFGNRAPHSADGLFDFPWLHDSEVAAVLDWVKDAIFYQVFPERFANGEPANDPPELTPWDAPPRPDSMYGGDLQGIIERLPYLSDLGINAVYLTPVFHAPSNHKYDTIDYFTVDPHFGDCQTLRELVALCHERGIKVVLDAVFNHMGWLSPQFQDVLAFGAGSRYAGWFHLSEFPLQINPRPNYGTFAFVASMPKLNTQNPEVREFLLRVATHWILQVDIDGWRLDVANEVDHAFWRELRQRVRAIKPSTYLLGEIMHQAEPWLHGDQFDGVMNYPLTRALIAWLKGEASANFFAHRLVQLQFAYSRPALEGCLNLLDSHDTPRLLSQLSGNRSLFCLGVAVLLTLPGAPSIYYGDEVGMMGGGDPDCRRGMLWKPAQQDTELHSWYKKLIALRHRHPALRRGDLEVCTVSEHCVGWWRREENGEEILVLVNSGPELVSLAGVLPAGAWRDLITEAIYQSKDNIGPFCSLILRRPN
jgi:glycosidase